MRSSYWAAVVVSAFVLIAAVSGAKVPTPQSIRAGAMVDAVQTGHRGLADPDGWWESANATLDGGDTATSVLLAGSASNFAATLASINKEDCRHGQCNGDAAEAPLSGSLFDIVSALLLRVRRLLPLRFQGPGGIISWMPPGQVHEGLPSYWRVRVDIFAEPSDGATKAAPLSISLFPPHLDAAAEGVLPTAAPGRLCDRTYARGDLLRKVPLEEARCFASHHSHPAEDFAELAADVTDVIVGFMARRLAAAGVISDATVQTVERSALHQWFAASHPRAIATEGHDAPACTLDISARDPPRCVLVQCANVAACVRQPTQVTTVVTRRVDTAVIVLTILACVLLLVRGFIARNKAMQLALAAVCGVAVVVAAVCFFVLQTVTNTRIGKYGAYGLFMVGGSSAVLQGIGSAVWFWFTQEFRRNGALQLVVMLCSLVSTALCYRYLGSSLSQMVHSSLGAAAVALFVVSFLRNPEAAFGLASVVVMVVFSARAAPRIVMVVFGVVRVVVWPLSAVLRRRSSNPTESSAQSPPSAAPRTLFRAAAAASPPPVGADDINDPTDDLPPEAFHAPRKAARGPAVQLPANEYAAHGERHTARALEELYAEIRRHPEKYADRLKAPEAVMRRAGVGSVTSEDEDESDFDSDELSRAGS